MRVDLVIADATVIDGTADATPFVADVAVLGDRIVEIGSLDRISRTTTVDAAGRVLAPGFVDTHTHVEAVALRGDDDRWAPISQGITTTLVGADGFGWTGPDHDERHRRWTDSAAIYGAPPPGMDAWVDPAGYLAHVRRSSLTDVVALAPHAPIRAAGMGDTPGRPGPDGWVRMRRALDDWFDAGAVGFATGLDYLPGRYADTDELVTVCEWVVERGGVYASHLRTQDGGRAGAWREAGEIGRRSGVPIRIAHERLDEEGEALLAEIAPGNDVTFDTYLYPAGCTSLAFHVPPELLADGVDALAARLRADRSLAANLAEVLQDRMAGRPEQQAIVAATTSGRHEGATLSGLAADAGVTLGEMAVELLRIELPEALLVYLWQDADSTWDATVARTLADERSLIATDGVYLGSSPHPRSFGAFPRVLGSFVRDQGFISLAAAIHKMTGKPADAYRLADRGRVEPGLRADLVLVDPATVSGPATYDEPRRPPTGIDMVLVGGRDTTWKGGNQ